MNEEEKSVLSAAAADREEVEEERSDGAAGSAYVIKKEEEPAVATTQEPAAVTGDGAKPQTEKGKKKMKMMETPALLQCNEVLASRNSRSNAKRSRNG